MTEEENNFEECIENKEEITEIHTIDKAFNRLLEFINNPFLSAILFTTEFDLTYKLNKKRLK